MDRRSYLAATGAVAFAGCLHGDDSPEPEPSDGSEPNVTVDEPGNESDPDDSDGNETTSPDDDEPPDDDDEQGSEPDDEPEPAEPSFEVDLSAPDAVERGEPVTVQVVVSNTGSGAGTFESDISIREGTGIWEQAESIAISLDPGTSDGREFTLELSENSDKVSIRIDAVDVSRTIDIFTPARFEFSLAAPDRVPVFEQFEMKLTVENTGDVAGAPNKDFQVYEDGEWERLLFLNEDVEAGSSHSRTKTDSMQSEVLQLDYRVPDATEWSVAAEFTPGYAQEYAASPPADDFFREFEGYVAQPVHFQYGDIYQTIYEYEGNEFDYLQLYFSNGGTYERDMAALWYGDERLLEDDEIELWGVGLQLWTYETTQGNERTIPMIELVDYELLGE